MSLEFIHTPKVRNVGDLFAHTRLYARAFLAYNLPVHALVRRPWPTAKQKQLRDQFWSKFRSQP